MVLLSDTKVAGPAAHSGPRLGAPAWNGTQGAFVCYSDDEWNRINPAVRLQGRSV